MTNILPLRERVFQSIRHGFFFCRNDELGQFNTEPNKYYHLDGTEPARVSAEDGLAQLEREGWIRRGVFWGPTSLEIFYTGRTLYSWVAEKRRNLTQRKVTDLSRKITERRLRFFDSNR